MARLTRSEKQEQTRDAIVSAALRLFPAQGFHRTTVEQISAAAGLTTGAVYSNFATKADVFLAAYSSQMDDWVAQLTTAVSRAENARGRVGAAVNMWIDYSTNQEAWFRLYVEFWAHAVGDDELRPRFASQFQRLPAAIAGAVAAATETAGAPTADDPHELAVAVNALGNGLLLHRLLVPEAVTGDGYQRMVLRLLGVEPPPGPS